MDINLKRTITGLEQQKLINTALCPDGQITRPNQLVKTGSIIGRRDSLTELQQKILTAAIALSYESRPNKPDHAAYKMHFNDFVKICGDSSSNDMYAYIVNEIEKISKKGLWLYDEQTQTLIRTQWFQAIAYRGQEILFQFTERVLSLIAAIDPGDIEYRLVKGIQYKGKHTLAVFEILRSWKSAGVVEYSIAEMMRQLSLEHTRYSYGQLRLRVIEPSIQEIYEWDDAIFVRFGPTFSGRRVEGIWFEVITGEKARQLRKQEPEFKFSSPEQKHGAIK
ncbi:replication initiation protein [Sporomusa termitida]|uniref:Initiator Replication protein n=1 Tax=Sporomusa termitida TaxID=2377 RepID=A0A517DWF9_9FIRM|nr:replication initiation protein [Sporomusa termitida]QDR81695.1 Initiator Replication protein [Sporomusa termitida]